MIKIIRFGLIFIFFSITIFAQNNKDAATDRGQQIIKSAQKVIGSENLNLRSFRLKKKTISLKSSFESVNEVKVLLPNNIYEVTNTILPRSRTTTKIWNGAKYKAISEAEILGQRTVVDITNTSLNSEFLEKIGRGKTNTSYVKRDSKEAFYDLNIWRVFFPLVLIQPFEPNLEFKFIGKAQSGSRFANVVEAKPLKGNTYRLFFDSETQHLLMMMQSYQGENTLTGEKGLYERKYYYSNREKMGDLLIPKTIKTEYKFTPDGKEPKVSYDTTEILEFQVNPELKENLFEIK